MRVLFETQIHCEQTVISIKTRKRSTLSKQKFPIRLDMISFLRSNAGEAIRVNAYMIRFVPLRKFACNAREPFVFLEMHTLDDHFEYQSIFQFALYLA